MESNHTDVVSGNIRAEAARQRIRQGDLAEAVGLSQQAMSRRLTGVVPFTVDELRAVASRLAVSVSQLLDGADSPTAATA